MIWFYMQRVIRPLINAITITAVMLFLSDATIMLLSGFVTVFLIQLSAQYLLIRLLHGLLPRNEFLSRSIPTLAILMALIIATVSISLLVPHLFLFFNALPWAFSKTFLALSTFLISFESNIRSPHSDLGPDYSLVKLLLNPRRQLEVLRQAWNRQQLRVAATRRQSENRQNVNQEDPKLLQLSEANQNELIKRQKEAIKRLPTDAIIDDVGLYRKHFEAEKKSAPISDRQSKPLEGSNSTTSIHDDAKHDAATKKSKAEAEELEKEYLDKLSQPAQEAYRNYRDFIKEYSLPYAQCALLYLDVVRSNPKEFIILEKRNLQSNTKEPSCISGLTSILHYKNSFLRLFEKSPAKNPYNQDDFFLPNNKKSGYAFHTYQMVDGHPLSLHLCERIEELANILSHDPTIRLITYDKSRNQEAPIKPQQSAFNPRSSQATITTSCRDTPSATPSSRSQTQTNLFAHDLFAHGTNLADLNLSEEEIQMIFNDNNLNIPFRN